MTQDFLIPGYETIYIRKETHECGFNEICNWNAQYPLGRPQVCNFDIRNPVDTVKLGKLDEPFVRSDSNFSFLIGLIISGILLTIVLGTLLVFLVDVPKALHLCFNLYCSLSDTRNLGRIHDVHPVP